MICLFKVEVELGADEAAMDLIVQDRLSEIVDPKIDRHGALRSVEVCKGDTEGSTNTYVVIADIDGVGLSFGRVFKDPGFPTSLKVTDLGAYASIAIWRRVN